MMLNSFLFFILILAGIGLNYFNIFGIFGTDTSGIMWIILRLSTAIGLTVIPVVVVERILAEALPRKHSTENELTSRRNVVALTFWTILLVGSETVIYLLASSNMGAKESIGIGSGTAVGTMILSMTLPVIAGVLGWRRTSHRS